MAEKRKLNTPQDAKSGQPEGIKTQVDYHQVFDGIQMGLGTWAWGDRMVWGYGTTHQTSDIREAFEVSVNAGIRLLDTAEVYGQGLSEKHIGQLLRDYPEADVRIASKFMPFPWRIGQSAFRRALTSSLARLGVKKISLYQIHFPLPLTSIRGLMDGMSEAVQKGLIDAVGVSNFSAEQTQLAYSQLVKNGCRLASNQVEYHLLDRSIERNGVLNLCQALGVKVIAYSPLAMGILTGKYTPENPPKGVRMQKYNREFLSRIRPLIDTMRQIGEDHEGKTPAQVAINWTICKGTLPIPGAKNKHQAEANAGAIGWKLSPSEVSRLDDMSNQIAR